MQYCRHGDVCDVDVVYDGVQFVGITPDGDWACDHRTSALANVLLGVRRGYRIPFAAVARLSREVLNEGRVHRHEQEWPDEWGASDVSYFLTAQAMVEPPVRWEHRIHNAMMHAYRSLEGLDGDEPLIVLAGWGLCCDAQGWLLESTPNDPECCYRWSSASWAAIEHLFHSGSDVQNDSARASPALSSTPGWRWTWTPGAIQPL